LIRQGKIGLIIDKTNGVLIQKTNA